MVATEDTVEVKGSTVVIVVFCFVVAPKLADAVDVVAVIVTDGLATETTGPKVVATEKTGTEVVATEETGTEVVATEETGRG